MTRFFCASQNISHDEIKLDNPQDLHHIRDVLRLKILDKLEVFDEKGNGHLCSIKKIAAGEIILTIKEKKYFCAKNRGVSITVACAIPKKSIMDDIIDKLTQLGVEKIIPLETHRVVVRLTPEKKAERLKRWRKIAQAASKQCQRSSQPVIEPVKSLEEVLATAGNYDLKLIPTLKGERRQLKDLIKSRKPVNVLIFIGPEGDFSVQEVESAVSKGCISVSLGELVLRVDTAVIAVVSHLKLSY